MLSDQKRRQLKQQTASENQNKPKYAPIFKKNKFTLGNEVQRGT